LNNLADNHSDAIADKSIVFDFRTTLQGPMQRFSQQAEMRKCFLLNHEQVFWRRFVLTISRNLKIG